MRSSSSVHLPIIKNLNSIYNEARVLSKSVTKKRNEADQRIKDSRLTNSSILNSNASHNPHFNKGISFKVEKQAVRLNIAQHMLRRSVGEKIDEQRVFDKFYKEFSRKPSKLFNSLDPDTSLKMNDLVIKFKRSFGYKNFNQSLGEDLLNKGSTVLGAAKSMSNEEIVKHFRKYDFKHPQYGNSKFILK